MEELPLEILARICRELELEDILSLRSQSRLLHTKLASELVWQNYVLQRWFNIDLIEYSLERAQAERDEVGSWMKLAMKRQALDLRLTKEIKRIADDRVSNDQRYIDASLLDDIFTNEHMYLPQLRRLQLPFDITYLKDINAKTALSRPGSIPTQISGYLHNDWISHQQKRLLNLRVVYIASTIIRVIRMDHVLKAILHVHTDKSKFRHAEHFLLELSHGDPSFYELLPLRKRVIDKVLTALSFSDSFTFPQLKAIVDRAILQENTLYEPINSDFKFESIQSSLIRYYSGEFSSLKPVSDSLLSYIIHLAGLRVVSSGLHDSSQILERDENSIVPLSSIDSVDYSSHQFVDKVVNFSQYSTTAFQLKQYLEFDPSKDMLLPNFGLKDNFKLACDPVVMEDGQMLVYRNLQINSGQLQSFTKRQVLGTRVIDLRSFEWVRKFSQIVDYITSAKTSFISMTTGFKGIPEDALLSFTNYQKVFNNNLLFAGLCHVIEGFQTDTKNADFDFLSYECEYSVKGMYLIPFYTPKNFIRFEESKFVRGQIVLQARQNLQGIVIENEMAYVRLLMMDGSVYLSAADNLIAEKLITTDLIYRFVECDELGFYFRSFDFGQLRFV